jgi:peptide/nickel transport system permease protein
VGALLVRRLLSLVPLLVLVSIGVFALSYQLDPESGGRRIIKKSVDRADSTAAGMDVRGKDVIGEIRRVLPRTISIAAVSMLFALIIGIPTGIVGGLRPGSLADRLSVVLATAGIAMPSFWVAMLLISWLAVSWDLLPAVGYAQLSDGLWEWFKHLIMPGIALGTLLAAAIARQLRASLMDVMGSSYIRTAWAKGLTPRRVVVGHALKNAATAPVTIISLQFGTLLGGSVIIESIFSIEGLGQLMITAIRSNDIPMIQGVVVFFVLVTTVINLLIDISYSMLNPKVRIT